MERHPYQVNPANGNPRDPKKPFLEIELIFPNNNTVKTLALADSGADCSCFDIGLAQAAELNINEFPVKEGIGVGGSFKYHLIPVKIKLKKKVIECNSAFTSIFDRNGKRLVGMNLLGREDFFQAFSFVMFDQNDNYLYLG